MKINIQDLSMGIGLGIISLGIMNTIYMQFSTMQEMLLYSFSLIPFGAILVMIAIMIRGKGK